MRNQRLGRSGYARYRQPALQKIVFQLPRCAHGCPLGIAHLRACSPDVSKSLLLLAVHCLTWAILDPALEAVEPLSFHGESPAAP